MKGKRARDVAIGIIFLMFGLSLSWRGWNALQHDETIPGTRKAGPMSGKHAIVGGLIGTAVGVSWCYVSFRKRKGDKDGNP